MCESPPHGLRNPAVSFAHPVVQWTVCEKRDEWLLLEREKESMLLGKAGQQSPPNRTDLEAQSTTGAGEKSGIYMATAW